MNVTQKRLYRSRHNKVISGVMGGLGEYFELDPVLIRVIYLGLSAFSAIFPGIIAYIFMALIMPLEPEGTPGAPAHH